MSHILLIVTIVFALLFVYTNGFHDSANAIATIVSSRVLSPRVAVVYGALLNFIGAFFGVAVAKVIGTGLVDISAVSGVVIICGLLAAIIWNFFTWYFKIPSSSSHALIGGLLGAAVIHSGYHIIHSQTVLFKVIIPMFVSPIIGGVIAYLITMIILGFCRQHTPLRVNKYFSYLQIFSSGFVAFSHGANDTSKTIGMVAVALFVFYNKAHFSIPVWVIVICALTMGMGTLSGGWRIIHTMSDKIVRLRPLHGFVAESSSAILLMFASRLGIPLSTTQLISGAIMGAGSTQHIPASRWRLVMKIILAWVLTLPMTMIVAAVIFQIYSIIH